MCSRHDFPATMCSLACPSLSSFFRHSGYVSQLGRVNARFRLTPAGIEVAQVPLAVAFCFLTLTPVSI
jgi:hypothetical protein